MSTGLAPGAAALPVGTGLPTNNLNDPVKMLAPVLEIFLPIGPSETNTMLGLWFDTLGFLHIYVQQAIAPDNIYTQVKIITFRLPVTIGFTIFSLGFGMFVARTVIIAMRGAAREAVSQIQLLLEQVLERIKQGQT